MYWKQEMHQRYPMMDPRVHRDIAQTYLQRCFAPRDSQNAAAAAVASANRALSSSSGGMGGGSPAALAAASASLVMISTAAKCAWA